MASLVSVNLLNRRKHICPYQITLNDIIIDRIFFVVLVTQNNRRMPLNENLYLNYWNDIPVAQSLLNNKYICENNVDYSIHI